MKTHIENLVDTLRRASDAYYNIGESSLSDKEYDDLEAELRSLDPTNPFFLGVGSEVRGDKVKLPFKMPSLDQVSDGDIEQWVKNNNLDNEQFVVADKLDGTSIMLVYDNDGHLQIAFTRGNGLEGQDVTRHVKRMKKAPLKVNGKVTVRAEVILTEEAFEELKPHFELEAGREFRNARNFVAGQMNSSDALALFYEHVDIIAYEIVWPEDDKIDQYDIMSSISFKTAKATLIKGSELTTEYLRGYLLTRLNDSAYQLDGLVIDVSSGITRKRLDEEKTNTRLNPAYAKKYKIVTSDNIAESEVLQVEWKVSKNGYLKPTVIIEPTDLMGVTIRRATGFNAKFIYTSKIGPGAKIEICRSGDVIPFIRRVLVASSATTLLPDFSEFGSYHWSDNEVDIILDNGTDDMQFQQLVFGVKAIGAEFLAEKSLRKLFDAGHQKVSDIINLAYNDEVELVGKIIGSEVMAKKGLNSVRNKLVPIPLEVLAEASGVFGRGLGAKRLRKVVDMYGKLFYLTVDELLRVDGFSNITAEQFIRNQGIFEDFLIDIKNCYYISNEPLTEVATTGSLLGKVFVFTGFRDAELEQQIKALGGEVGQAVNSKTTHLVAKDTTKKSSKMIKAEKSGVNIISRAELVELTKNI